jgi:glutamate-1-semialdehyde 2,1-aminomutase
MEQGLRDAAAAALPITINRVGSMVGLFFGSEKVRDYKEAKSTNFKLYGKFHRRMMMEGGVYLPPSAFETIFVSAAHTEEDLDHVIEAAGRAFKGIAR